MKRRRAAEADGGFTALGALVVLVVIVGVAWAGLFVWKKYQAGRRPADAPDSSQQTTTVGGQRYLTIKEWFVRMPYTGRLHLNYTVFGKAATFSSDELTAADKKCRGFGGVISRLSAGDPLGIGTGLTAGKLPQQNGTFSLDIAADGSYTLSSPATGSSAVPYAFANNYYFIFTHAQSGCGNVKATASLEQQTNSAVAGLVPHLETTISNTASPSSGQ